ncbi:MAG: class I SAM-dependent methyltransferase [Deltaproteobacteria bacterium]|nr:class I SAM-dependent methyltransferase [Deltaproteobacteria bacterium]
MKEKMNAPEYIRGGKQKLFYAESETTSWPCPLCQSPHSGLLDQERGSLQIRRCLHCQLIRVSPRIKNPEEIYWGDPEKYFQESRLIFSGEQKHHRETTYLHDINLIQKFKPRGKLLDVGCNMGFFLKKTMECGYEGYGIDPSPSLTEIGKKNLNLNIETAFLEKTTHEKNFFDVITFTDVFEHLVNPQEILSKAKSLLKKDGILLIKVPNAKFNLFKWFVIRKILKNKTYDIFDSYEHVVHYTDKTLTSMLRLCGFTPLLTYVAPPVQLPNWHKFVGHYYQYATPWYMDFRKKTARKLCYRMAWLEKKILGRCGYLAPNIGIIARATEGDLKESF